ncbi:MAG: hypothetical protein EOO71_01285 [Myxococcaceae bacterium]|nr:MAG: hypothetical protein EOO71_01285 [Myxococcaceae bacterium]
MGWTFDFYFNRATAAHVINDMHNKLRQITTQEAASAKVGHSDAKESNARGAVIYNKGAGPMPAHNLTGAWQQKTWTTPGGNDQYKLLLSQVCNWLDGNGDIPITESEAAHAKFSLSDFAGGTCYMVLFWQKAM